jgi:anhydro-N-acetylmuramic acid kinase
MSTRWIIGLASGSSATGVSAALVETEGAGLDLQVRPLLTVFQPYARDLRELLRRAGRAESADVKQVCLLHRLLGETFAGAARQAADRASFSLRNVHCIGCPGHTIWHEPEGRFPSTLGLGMPAIVAERTGVTTVSDFRSRDLAAGGQGTWVEALPDYLMFRHLQESRLLLHLGGVASAVVLPSGCRPQEIAGFGIGPCNLLLDGLIRHLTAGKEECDSGGKYGVQGRCLEPLLERWHSHPYFQRRPPRNLHRTSLADEFILPGLRFAREQQSSVHDMLCTATHLIARSASSVCRRFLGDCWPPDRLILSGGGTRNGLLWHLLEQQLSGVRLEKSDQHGVPADSRQAIGSSILAALTVDGAVGNLPSVTGASGSRLLGNLTPGSSGNWARCLAWMATQAAPLAVVDD